MLEWATRWERRKNYENGVLMDDDADDGRYSVVHRPGFGEGLDVVAESQIRDLLAELDVDDPEHPDVWITDEMTGWELVARGRASIMLVLQNADDELPPRTMTRVSRDRAVDVFMKLVQERLDELLAEPWDRQGSSRP